MHPVLFRTGNLVVTSFGAMVLAAIIVSLWLYSREIAWSGLPERALGAAALGIFGGVFVGKWVWMIEFLGTNSFENLLMRGGVSLLGCLAGAVGTGLVALWLGDVPLLPAVSAATPALATAHVFGRMGCFLTGQDYGLPTDLPWAVAFPRGLPPTTVPVHPTQLYEAFALAALVWASLRWRRRGVGDADVFGRYLVLAGSIHFATEFIKVNVGILGPLAFWQLIAMIVIVAGAAIIYRARLTNAAAARSETGG